MGVLEVFSAINSFPVQLGVSVVAILAGVGMVLLRSKVAAITFFAYGLGSGALLLASRNNATWQSLFDGLAVLAAVWALVPVVLSMTRKGGYVAVAAGWLVVAMACSLLQYSTRFDAQYTGIDPRIMGAAAVVFMALSLAMAGSVLFQQRHAFRRRKLAS